MKIGAWYQKNKGCAFIVWAPFRKSVAVQTLSPKKRIIELKKDSQGYWHGTRKDITPDTTYFYSLDNKIEKPDPASFYQAQGIHNPSTVIDHSSYKWQDNKWKCHRLEEMIMYELHVGTFSSEGTFSGVIKRLNHLKKLGVNAIEIMPVAQFPGKRNWGYDGVHPFTVQNSYGGPQELKKLVDCCHQTGIAVILDVVYNHLGPEGNYLADFGPYFTKKYKTPWGWAINFDGKESRGVRKFFIQNALYWFEHFHIDALRLDAIHGIHDNSEKNIFKELTDEVEKYSKAKKQRHYLIAESDLNDSRIIEPKEKGGYGIHAQWLDDFHHSLHTIITKERNGYYKDFGKLKHLVKSLKEGFVYDFIYSSYRKKYHGSSSKHLEPKQFIVYTQNHDQIGNRVKGDRLSHLVDFESLKLAAGATIFSPYIPMLFMGEEFAANTPFLYFISHYCPELAKAVEKGRRNKLRKNGWREISPDPSNKQTFLKSKLKWDLLKSFKHKIMYGFYQEIIKIRKSTKTLDRTGIEIIYDETNKTIEIIKSIKGASILLLLNFNTSRVTLTRTNSAKTNLKKIIDSADKKWLGAGSLSPQIISSSSKITLQPRSFILFKN